MRLTPRQVNTLLCHKTLGQCLKAAIPDQMALFWKPGVLTISKNMLDSRAQVKAFRVWREMNLVVGAKRIGFVIASIA